MGIDVINTKEIKLQAFGRLLDILDELREKCPWDKVQTNESLRTNTIEETYELCEAIIKNDPAEIKKELGDLLLHVVFYAKIADEKSQFDIADVCNTLCDKLIFRHPHVFGEIQAKTAHQVEQNWEQIKLKEKGGNKTVLQGVPASLPSIAKAHRIQDKARNAGFDWNKKEDVWQKVEEELNELKHEIHEMNDDRIESEFGDFFFSLINAARLYGIDPDNALERTNQEFIRRFNYIEQKAKETGKSLKEMTLDEMEVFWQEAKKNISFGK
jgi:XTP/dITP diphosphohydrolase